MSIGIYFDLRNPPPWRRPWDEVYSRALERAEEAERLGLGSVWVTEHHFFEDGYLPQPLTFAAALAARTRRVRIGTAVLLAGLRPAVDIAEQAAVIDLVSGGRFELGLGAGYRVPEFTAYGADITQRFELLEARAREVRRLWDEGTVTPGPLQARPPIWIGGGGPRAARIAGRLGEGLLMLNGKILDEYRATLTATGHAPTLGGLGGLANLIVAEDPEAAWPRIAPHLAYQWGSYGRYGVEGTPAEGSFAERPPEQLRHPGPAMNPPRFDLVDAAEAIRRLRAWLEPLPARHVFFWDSIAGMPDDLVADHIRLLATEVAPAIADLVGRAQAPPVSR
jgi:alkanesulfonate monooxygenase SsuD/methylene tetrahydromethanopterin reductase-like flavin-dependent oxidoreductase (luciferase family)